MIEDPIAYTDVSIAKGEPEKGDTAMSRLFDPIKTLSPTQYGLRLLDIQSTLRIWRTERIDLKRAAFIAEGQLSLRKAQQIARLLKAEGYTEVPGKSAEAQNRWIEIATATDDDLALDEAQRKYNEAKYQLDLCEVGIRNMEDDRVAIDQLLRAMEIEADWRKLW